MELTLSQICEFGQCTVSSRKFMEGEKIVNAKQILKCEKKVLESQGIDVTAYCLQTSNLKGKRHEIKGLIQEDGTITSFLCTCAAGLSQRCKHILAVLLYCYRISINKLEELSCPDVECARSQSTKQKLEQNKAVKIKDHVCYSSSYRSCNAIKVPDELRLKIIQRLRQTGPNALTNHM